jgi:Type IV secretory pathway, VirB11 components, and related ATPases involved in archaeal flagella biosynthesis
MREQALTTPTDRLETVSTEHDHLKDYLSQYNAKTGVYPTYAPELTDEHEVERPELLYPADPPIFIHVHPTDEHDVLYETIEPSLSESEQTVYNRLRTRVLERSAMNPALDADDGLERHIDELLDDILTVTDSDKSMLDRLRGRLQISASSINVSRSTYTRLKYLLQRDISGLGPLEPVMADPQNEDIHIIGPHQCYVDHGTFGMLPTTVNFGTSEQFNNWLQNMGERMEHPISDSDPIVDSTLPDGSRINIIYSDDVSVKGPSLTIRQGEDTPLSIFQITKFGTLSPELAAYLWLALENEQTIFVVGETASGKTTTLNSMLSFVPRDDKIYTAEDTAEVQPPHDNWQQLLTRESGDEGAAVDMFDLVAAALRSRPDYIIVGEVRGAEAQMAFQAAQTGHPVLLTFHASDIVSMVQRFTSNPINVPETFMDNCDIALFQNRVKQGDEILRRVTSVREIEGYSSNADGVVTRQAFSWDPRSDTVEFTGRNNSFVLEDQIATLLGYEDTRQIYDELDRRAEIIRRLIANDVTGYEEVNQALETIQTSGVEALDIDSYQLV